MLIEDFIRFFRLGERQAMLRAAGTIVGLGAKTMSGSGNSGI